MRPWDYPPEYGTEVNERCGRDRCTGTIVFDPDTDGEDIEEIIADGNTCNACGWRLSDD